MRKINFYYERKQVCRTDAHRCVSSLIFLMIRCFEKIEERLQPHTSTTYMCTVAYDFSEAGDQYTCTKKLEIVVVRLSLSLSMYVSQAYRYRRHRNETCMTSLSYTYSVHIPAHTYTHSHAIHIRVGFDNNENILQFPTCHSMGGIFRHYVCYTSIYLSCTRMCVFVT